jgi:hypothetical protein
MTGKDKPRPATLLDQFTNSLAPKIEQSRDLRRDRRSHTTICLCFRTYLTADVAICCRLLVRQYASPHLRHEIVHETDTHRWGRSPPFIVYLGFKIAMSTLTTSFTNLIPCFCHWHFALANGTTAGRDLFAGE